MDSKSLTFYDKMTLDEQKCQIDAASFADKGDLILRSHAPEEIVSSINCEQFYLIFNSSGDELHSELLKIARKDQLLFASDFECWNKDKIDEGGFLSWLSTIAKAGRNKLLTWLLEADLEMLLASFAGYIEVLKTEHLESIDEYIGDKPFFTLDQLYYINITGDDFDVVREVVDTLFELRKPMYVQFLESLICVNELQVLEDAYQLRTERLAWYGFPAYDEAIKAYHAIRDWQLVEKKEAKSPALHEKEADNFLPIELRGQENTFFDQAYNIFHQITDHDEIPFELSSLANKTIIFDNMDFRKADSLILAVLKTKTILSVALEKITGKSLNKAAEILGKYWLEDIHRFGVGVIQSLRDAAKETFFQSGFSEIGDFLIFLGDPYKNVFSGLLKFFPIKNSEDLFAEVEKKQFFLSLEEIDRMHYTLKELADLVIFLKEHFGDDLKEALHNDYYELNTETPFPSLIQFMATSFVWSVLKKELRFEPLNINETAAFIKSVYISDKGLKTFRKEDVENWKKLISSDSADNSLLNHILGIIHEETSLINTDYPVEPSMIKSLLIKTA